MKNNQWRWGKRSSEKEGKKQKSNNVTEGENDSAFVGRVLALAAQPEVLLWCWNYLQATEMAKFHFVKREGKSTQALIWTYPSSILENHLSAKPYLWASLTGLIRKSGGEKFLEILKFFLFNTMSPMILFARCKVFFSGRQLCVFSGI